MCSPSRYMSLRIMAINGKHNHIICTMFGPLSNRSEAHAQYNANVLPDSPANDHHTGDPKVIQFSTQCRCRAQVALPGAVYVHACRYGCFASRSTPGMWPMQTCMRSDTLTATETTLASTYTGINSRHASTIHVDMHMQMHIQLTWLQTFKSSRCAHTSKHLGIIWKIQNIYMAAHHNTKATCINLNWHSEM